MQKLFEGDVGQESAIELMNFISLQNDVPNISDICKGKNVEVVDNGNRFEFVLPLSKKTITFKILSHKDEEKVQAEIKRMKKKTHSSTISYDLTSRLKQVIVAVDGEEDRNTINKFTAI